MKKRSIALLCCCVQLFLSGCGSGGQTMEGAKPAALDALPKEQSVQYRAELEEVSGESYEGDALLLTYRYEVPVLRACGSDGEALAEEDLTVESVELEEQGDRTVLTARLTWEGQALAVTLDIQ